MVAGLTFAQASAGAMAAPSASPSASPTPSAAHSAHAPPAAMLKSKEAQSWAKSAHATLAKPLPKAAHAVAPAAAANSAPTITSIAATPTTIHSGDTVRWDVHTSPNVVSVAAHVTLATLQLQRTAPGHFTLAFVIPANTPGLFHGTYNVDVIAKANDGDTATKTISMTFQ